MRISAQDQMILGLINHVRGDQSGIVVFKDFTDDFIGQGIHQPGLSLRQGEYPRPYLWRKHLLRLVCVLIQEFIYLCFAKVVQAY